MSKISEEKLCYMARLFKALGEGTRLKILFFIANGKKCQCDIIPHIGLSQPAISRHLQILVNSGLLNLKKEGNKRVYSLTKEAKRVLGSLG